MSFRVGTVNDDFTTPRRTAIPRLWRRWRRVDTDPLAALLTQESKTHDYADLDGLADFEVNQVTRTPATAGVAVLLNTNAVDPYRHGPYHRVLCRPHGERMLSRGITWRVAYVPEADREPVAFASAHRPPRRYRHLWGEFDDNLETWVRQREARGQLVVLGMDANVRWWGRRRLARRLGLWQKGRGVDAVFVSREFKIRYRGRLALGSSDHDARQVRLWLRTWPRN